MKKLAVLSIALLVLTTLAFAEVKVEPVVAFSGSGTLTWGIDLDSDPMNTGFKNENSANLTVTLVSKSTETKGGGEGDMVYGYIALKDMSLVLNTDNNFTSGDDDEAKLVSVPAATDSDADGEIDQYLIFEDNDNTVKISTDIILPPTVEAYVVLGPAKWFIYAAPDLKLSYADDLEDDGDDYWAEGSDDGDNVAPNPDGDAGATGIEVAAGPATITALVASTKDWTAAGTYSIAAKAALAVGPATIKVGVNYDLATGGVLGLGGSAAVTAGPATINAAFDMTTATGTPMEIRAGAKLALPDLLDVTADMAYGAGAAANWGFDVEAGAALKAVAGLDFSVLLGLWDLTDTLSWGVKTVAGYKVAMGETNYVKPGVEAYVSSLAGADLRVALIAKIDAVLIPNTTFTLQYKDWDLTDSPSFTGLDRAFTFATKVAY